MYVISMKWQASEPRRAPAILIRLRLFFCVRFHFDYILILITFTFINIAILDVGMNK